MVEKKEQKKERNLFSIKTNVHPGDVRKKRKTSHKTTSPKTTEEEEEALPEVVLDKLTHEALTEGQITLGCISEVQEFNIEISLPNCLVAHLHISNISESYTRLLKKLTKGKRPEETIYKLSELYNVGDCIAVKVTSPGTSPKWRAYLALDPGSVNFGLRGCTLNQGSVVQCAVQSVEDKGFVLHTGIPGVHGAFLKTKDYKGPATFGIGSVFLGTVKKVTSLEEETKGEPLLKINISYNYEDVAPKRANITESTTLSSIIPGSMCRAEITKVLKGGLSIKVGSMTGDVGQHYLESPNSKLEDYSVGQIIDVRLLFKTMLRNRARFTLNLSMKVVQTLEVGDIFQPIICRSSQNGVFVTLPKNNIGFCSAANIGDKSVDKNMIKTHFPIESRVLCGVKFFHFMDRSYTVSNLTKDIQRNTLTYDNIHPGMVVDVKILHHKPGGVDVEIGKKVWGFITKQHITETAMGEYKAKVPIGEILKAKVLDNDGKRVYLTMKKSLVDSILPIITKISSDLVGKVALGTISTISELGLRIQFYNKVDGFLHRKLMSVENDDNLSELYRVGQVIQCYVSGICPETNRMYLTSDPKGIKRVDRNNIEMNKPFSCVITSLEDDEINVKVRGIDKSGVISIYNLSDDVNLSKAIFETLREGDTIKNAYILSASKEDIFLTIKPDACRWRSQLSGSHIMKEDEIIPVTVIDIMHEYLTVSLSHTKKFCVFRSNCDLSSLSAFSEGESFKNLDVQLGQTLHMKIMELKSEVGSSRTNINFSEVLVDKSRVSVQIVLDFLSDERILRESFKRHGGILESLASIKQGDQFVGRVIGATKNGLLVLLDLPGVDSSICGIEGVITSSDSCYTNNPAGFRIKTTVVHTDFVNKALHLMSVRENMCISSEKSKVTVGVTLKCEVVLIRKEFIVALLPSEGNGDKFVYLPSKRHYNDFSYRHIFFKIGDKYDVIIRYSKNGVVIGELLSDVDGKIDEIKVKEFVHRLKLVRTYEENSCKICLTGSEHLAADARAKLEKLLPINMSYLKCKRFVKLPEYKLQDNIPQITWLYYRDQVNTKRFLNKKVKKVMKSDGTWEKQKRGKRKITNVSEKVDNKKSDLKRKRIDEDEGSSEKVEIPAKKSLKKNTIKEGEIPEKKSLKKKTIKEGEIPEKKSLKKKTIKEGEILEKKSLKKKTIKEVDDNPKKRETIEIKDERCATKSLQLETKGFCWNDNITNGDVCNGESSSDEEEEEKLKEKTKKLSKAERLQKAAEEEDRLRQSELVRVQKDRVPESVMDYEELLQASPNSSAIWIQFISYHLQNAEIEKARAVAVRALQRIPPTEEHERVNVWTVMLRLEVMYGDKESLITSFNEALATNEQKKIYNAMVLIYGEANKVQEAEELYRKMCKKFSQDPEVWMNAILFMFKFNNGKKAKQILDKSLLSLVKQDHVAVIHRYAQFEFQYGDPEKGKTVYESLVGNYPKRIDIWGVYVDMLTKQKDISAARRVLERMISLKLRLPKMRSIFKRLLQFEKLHGNEDSVEEVKNRVLEYVNAALGE